jgi:primosomal protein N' (replication factor Y)
VVATPGAEPIAAGGYAAAVFLDADLALSRAALRVEEEALRRWLNAAALVRPAGEVLVVGDAAWAPVQALIRWDPEGFARRELANRAELGLPPARRAAVLTGAPEVLARAATDLPGSARVLGPVVVEEGRERSIITVEWTDSGQLARHLHDAQAVATARKDQPLTVRLDPDDLA